MTKDKLKELLAGPFGDLVKAISHKNEPKTSAPLDEYQVDKHPVFNVLERPDVPRKNKAGDTISPRKVNRIGLAFEKMITGRAAAFLCANPIIYHAMPATPAEERMLAAFKKVNENAKLDYKNQGILEMRMSETEVAEIWYMDPVDPDGDDYWAGTDIKGQFKPRLFLSSASLLDKIWPVWDAQDNLIAFGREYAQRGDDGKEIKRFDLYTTEKIYEGIQNGSDWAVDAKVNEVKKIVIVYHRQSDVEWADVKTEIRRLEFLQSNLADSNDKTMSPILHVAGELTSLPDGTAGRVIKGPAETKVGYVTSDNAPEALKLEYELLHKYIHMMSDTVDLSPETLRGLGQPSEASMELMFMPALLKAARHSKTFGECIQRRINLVKKMLVTIDPSLKDGTSLVITPNFDVFLPKDIAGVVNYLSTAIMGDRPIISQETAVNMLQGSMRGDGKAELLKIQAEMAAQAAAPGGLDDQMNNDQ